MTQNALITNAREQTAVTLPEPRCGVRVREATQEDFEFIDGLQKMHSHMVGWSPRKAIETNIEQGNVLIAEEVHEGVSGCKGDGVKQERGAADGRVTPSSNHRVTPASPLGYCTFRDQYMKRDDVGIIYQLNVLPIRHRHLVGATLVKAVFDRAAYGCRLFCCWCAQDIQANWFWEAIGFVPLAFRTGSRTKQRIHIFWERRIRENDDVTPYWFPSQTQNGAVAEDRLVLPIPPDSHWRDVKPVVLPGMEGNKGLEDKEQPKTLPGGAAVRPRPEQPKGAKVTKAQKAAIARSKSKHLGGVPAGKAAVITAGGVRYVERADAPAEEELEPKKPKKPRKPRQKNDPKLVKAARELRDRYLEQVNAPGGRLLPGAHGKYDVSRQLESRSSVQDEAVVEELPRLDAA